MGLINRIGDIIESNLSTLAERADEPEVAINAAIRALEDALAEARSGTIRLMADRKDVAGAWREAEFQLLEWERRAELALEHGREDLARAALGTKARIEREAAPIRRDLEAIDGALKRLADDTALVQQKLADARSRRRSLSARHRSAVDRLRVRSTLYDGRLEEALARMPDLQARIDEIEARGELAPGPRPRTLAEEIDSLAAAAKVEQDLAALKARMPGR